jgi:hypothetical protein
MQSRRLVAHSLRGGTRPAQPMIMGFLDTVPAEGQTVAPSTSDLRSWHPSVGALAMLVRLHAQRNERAPM